MNGAIGFALDAVDFSDVADTSYSAIEFGASVFGRLALLRSKILTFDANEKISVNVKGRS